jgi:hypothetical protein
MWINQEEAPRFFGQFSIGWGRTVSGEMDILNVLVDYGTIINYG